MNNYLVKIVFYITIFICSVACNFKSNKESYTPKGNERIEVWNDTKDYYLNHINRAITLTDSLSQFNVDDSKTKKIFWKVRESFKKVESYAGALNPEVTHRVNGPALPVFKDDSGKVIDPIGFQKLEETLYNEQTSQKEFLRDVYFIKGFLENLKGNIVDKKPTARRFFVGTYQQLMRLISLSMVGFDTPITGKSIQETTISLKGLEEVYKLSIQKIIKEKNLELDETFLNDIKKAIHFIKKDSDFETFDRYTFIKDYLNVITRDWVQIRKESKLWDGKSFSYAINFDAPTFFEENSFNTNFFLDVNDKNPTKERIALGEKLFFDKNLSKKGNMSCASCHSPSKAYTDGLALGRDNSGHMLDRNSPTLINSIYQKAFFWDGRASTLQNQISSVFTNKKEFNAEVHEFSGNIMIDTTYISLFKKAYGVIPKKNKEVIRALSVYVSTLSGFNSKFDKNIRNEEDTFNESEKRGFNLFMGKALCATCHFMPLTNGTVPPFFNETEKEVIGVSRTLENKEVDSDRGFYWVHEEEIHDKMFKTPTLRNIALTAPYMHNGVYNTLEEVMDFYNKGGGAGLGFEMPHQTLPFDNLELSKEEIKDIIAFMKTLTDLPEETIY